MLKGKKEIDFLLVNPPNAFAQYIGSKLNSAVLKYPVLSLASLAAVLRQEGARVAILDLGIVGNYDGLERVFEKVRPRYIGFTGTTPLFPKVVEVSTRCKQILGNEVTILVGGPHATAVPEESLQSSAIDILVYGEGERTIVDIWKGKKLSEIRGIYYKDNGKVVKTTLRELIPSLDDLPFLAVDLYESKFYHSAKQLSKATPNFQYESSRGCKGVCTFCNKNISGTRFRMKSPERVVSEIEYILSHGYKEIRFVDDQFNADIDRAIKICELIIKKNLKFPWSLASGIRVDTVNEEFFRMAKKAGCHQMGIGFEAGTQESLNSIKKGITLEQSLNCMKLLRKVGIETIGFFILGLPEDTEESMEETINFALKLRPDFAKATILIPFPGTTLFRQYEQKGLIKTREWDKYNFHLVKEIYKHPTLDFSVLQKYYDRFYIKFYLSPVFLYRKLLSSVQNFSLVDNLNVGLQTFLPSMFAPQLFSFKDAYECYEETIAKKI